MLGRGLWLFPLLLIPVVVAACGSSGGGDPAGDGDDPAAAREQVVAAAREAADRLAQVGRISKVGGEWTVCGSPPAEAVEYGADGRLDSGGDQTGAIDAAADAMTEAGWAVTDEGTDPYRWVNLERDGLTASLRPDPLEGSDAVAWAIASSCIPVGDGESSEFDFKREEL